MISREEYIDGDKFESIADIGFGDKYTKELPLNIKRLNKFIENFKEESLPIVYVDNDRIRKFFTLIKDIKTPFKLLSHNGDSTFIEEEVKNRPSCVVKWYGQNINAPNNENIVSLPIGLERGHWSTKRYGKKGYKHNKIYKYSTIDTSIKDKLLYINFNPNTNKSKRVPLLSHFKKEPWTYVRLGGIRGNLDQYFKECKESHFVLCPDGNGIDCHRNWEMLYLGVIPIIENSYFHNRVYKELPVLIVDNFKNINSELLKTYKIPTYFNNEKLKFSYWEKLIKNG